MAVFPWEGSVGTGGRRLNWAAARPKGVPLAVPALVVFLHLILPCLQLSAMAGLVVPVGLTAGVPVAFATVLKGELEQVGQGS